MQFLLQLATLFMGAAAAASLSESVAKGAKARKEHKQLKRGMILPKEAARELEHRIGGRVVVGKDLEGPMLVIMRLRSGVRPPEEFVGYRVQVHRTAAEEAALAKRRARDAAEEYLETRGLVLVGNVYEDEEEAGGMVVVGNLYD